MATAAGVRDGGCILIADDDEGLRRVFARILEDAGHQVFLASDGRQAAGLLAGVPFDVIISDIRMPEMSGMELLRLVRQRDLDLPVLLVTAAPDVATAIEAIEYGAYRYISKPVDPALLCASVRSAVGLQRLARLKREALKLLGHSSRLASDRAGLEAAFVRAIESLWVASQPIVRPVDHTVFGYEALLRTEEASLPSPVAVLDAAERLGKLDQVGRMMRDRAAAAMPAVGRGVLFVNLHPHELADESLYDSSSPLGRMASRVVLEITERAALEGLQDVRERVGRLRRMGFRLAVDDLGAGYAGLTSFATLEPEVVKFDMSLVRGVDSNDVKRRIIDKMTTLAHDMDILVVAEGVETAAERDALVSVGCELMQGFLFARPAAGFPEVVW
jgi:EAL domain-containing protein (putative c-di-GMP-specific phosphodiesterase class I)/CheY-like chemotaxis protein